MTDPKEADEEKRDGDLVRFRGLKSNGTKTYAKENLVALTVYKIDLETVMSTNI